MGTKYLTTRITAFFCLFLIFIATAVATFARTSAEVAEQHDLTTSVSDLDAPTFSQISSASKIYSADSPVMIHHCDKTYKPREDSYEPIPTSDGVPINSERSYVNATDSTGETIRLTPVDKWISPNNANANGAVTVRITLDRSLPDEYKYYEDKTKFKDLYDFIAIPDNTTAVRYGQVFYRTGELFSNEFTSGWSTLELTNQHDASHQLQFIMLFPPEKIVQVVVIRKVKKDWLTHYSLMAIYRFDTYA